MDGLNEQTEPAMTVSVRPWARGTVVAPEGELDLDTAELLRDALERQLRGRWPHILVDCAGLRFCDSTGLRVILRARTAAQAAGGGLDLVAPRPALLRLLALTGTEEVFPVYASVAEAEAEGAIEPPGPSDRRNRR
ncbi:STAS domain-containing protein [Kitasatospora sp. RB6PN24]|uniref:STAS domain-containing protein n=1 Tax=Kitasatospora humi TaxID=2893891 RepID=UPI001E3C4EB3|nr:STAS domain-containing protein [Kitasatospora humi]MCC9307909.1 STAS domain-containing protein [Kitasatospora humi]